MRRIKRYIDVDVYTEALNRLRHVFDIFDSVAVMFSGGKDSLAALHLTWEVARELGHSRVNVVFRDEELIPQSVVDFVDGYRRKPWVNMYWYAVPLKSQKYVLGVAEEYVQWDPGREWVRPKPEWAIILPEGDPRVFDQYSMDAFVAENFKGKVAFVTGIRASESLVRFAACMNKLNENYITRPFTPGRKSTAKNVMMVKPLFDWEEDDVFYYFYANGLEYCPYYDAQLWGGQSLRVSTPLHAEYAKRFGRLKVAAPELYARVIEIFPEMTVQERYYRELDLKAMRERYGESFDGIRRWIRDNIRDAGERRMAMRRVDEAEKLHRHSPQAYPPGHVFRIIMGGAYKRAIGPVGAGRKERA